ncbi:hypothetical protein HanIR_Chr11g0516971 [Helianthus annuus]|nr:hypothetical protein HanIR_Chr11g0516971 [Helianthus annuus]
MRKHECVIDWYVPRFASLFETIGLDAMFGRRNDSIIIISSSNRIRLRIPHDDKSKNPKEIFKICW